MNITIRRDKPEIDLVVEWIFSNEPLTEDERVLCSPYIVDRWIYIGAGECTATVGERAPVTMTAGNLYNLKDWVGTINHVEYPPTGCAHFVVVFYDRPATSFTMVHGDSQMDIPASDKERLLIVVSGHVVINGKYLPTRAIAKIPEGKASVVAGSLPRIHTPQEMQNTAFTLALIER
jgi:hypothetical protein